MGKTSTESDIVYFLDPVSTAISKYENLSSIPSIRKILLGIKHPSFASIYLSKQLRKIKI